MNVMNEFKRFLQGLAYARRVTHDVTHLPEVAEELQAEIVDYVNIEPHKVSGHQYSVEILPDEVLAEMRDMGGGWFQRMRVWVHQKTLH